MKMVNTPEWASVIKGIIRSEMALRTITYAELSRRLEHQFGTHQTESNLKAKVNKGVLGAQLFVQILAVLGTENLNLKSVVKIYHELQNPAP